MFERFTTAARTVVTEAQEFARDAGATSIDSRHLLAAIANHDGRGRAALTSIDVAPDELVASVRCGPLDPDALASIGIDLDAVRSRAEDVFGPGALDRAARGGRGHLPFARDGKKALELALREALRLQSRTIDDAHLLLGVLRSGGAGRDALLQADVDVVALRAAAESRPAA